MLIIFIATWISPLWPFEHALHSSLTLLGFGLLWRYTLKYGIGNRDFFLIIVFLSVHSLAARWLYSNVPYDAWLQSTLGFSLRETLGWSRNNFDRLVHFLFGLCFTPAFASHAMSRHQLGPKVAFYIAIAAVMISSLWYEWFELGVAITMSEENAEAYNGQQGDMWDAHKDMIMATLGSLVWARSYTAARQPTLVDNATKPFTPSSRRNNTK